MTPSTEQTHFYSVVPSGQNYCLRAVAGSGKTTTIVGLCQRLPQPCQPLFLAFNKTVAEELKTRLPFYAKASTFHALCYGALKKQLPTLGKADGRKMAKILKTYVPQVKDRIEWESDYMRLCGVAKAYGYGVLSSCPTLDVLSDEYGFLMIVWNDYCVTSVNQFDSEFVTHFAKQTTLCSHLFEEVTE